MSETSSNPLGGISPAALSFQCDLIQRVHRPAPRFAQRITSLGYAWLLLGDAVLELRQELDKPALQRSTLAARSQLIEIAALATRAARDLEIESAADAAHQDIPF